MTETSPTRHRRKFLVVVDDTSECRVALRYACGRASSTNGQVALLRVIEPGDFQHWLSVEERMREEARAEAERLLQGLAAEISERVHIMPELMVREGTAFNEVLAQIEEDPQMRVLVLGAATGPEGPGPLVSALAGRMPGNMHIPVTVVPGNLTNEQVDELV
tara:strand:+ start:101 stop:586 length:486 start_codon:yes stop_codon:yes gene_type:complete